MDYFGKFVYMIHCIDCDRAWNLDEEDLKKDRLSCHDPSCAAEFSIYDGIKKGLKVYEENALQANSFLANYIFFHTIDVKVGFMKNYKLPEGVLRVHKVRATPLENFSVGVSNITSEGFDVFTSLHENTDISLFGLDAKVMLYINANMENYSATWMHLLQLSLKNLVDGDYSTSILFAEIAFESFVDTFLFMGYLEKGELSEDEIYELLEDKKIPSKVNTLMKELYKTKLSKMDDWIGWETKVLRWRNQIAHGSRVLFDKEEAQYAYSIVVDAIFYFAENIDLYFKSIGEPNGLFYRT